MQPIIHIEGLSKRYKQAIALQQVSLQVPAGAIYGFVGRNGSGKTTLIKALLGMVHPSAGRIAVFGMNPLLRQEGVAIRRRIGFVSEEKQLYNYMTVDGIIEFTRSFFPRWDRSTEQKLIELFELTRNQRIASLSKGMRSRLALLLALSRNAELLILDEPSSGLDPAITEAMLQILVAGTARSGTTIFFSTHHIGEVEQIADHVCFIEKGEIRLQGLVDDVKESYKRIRVVFAQPVAPELLAALPGVRQYAAEGRSASIVIEQEAAAAVDQLRRHGATAVEVSGMTLKEIFLDTIAPEAHHALA